MEENKLNELIDKTVGTKGNLQIPSYWMNKTLKDIINHVNTQDQNIDFNIQYLLERTSDLQNRLDTEKNFEIYVMSTPSSQPSGNTWYIRCNRYNKIYLSTSTNKYVELQTLSDDDILQEHIIEVTCATSSNDSHGSLYFPESIKWADNNPPVFKANCTILIRIVNNLGIWYSFE